ncbi:MAG: hypothetical protein BA870_02075 [Desulfuromonadales bacterium C00003094]|nr:MAG: hypothetical protein BA870_02075 [Desulfuromonadales bacterium C00003094]
MLRIILATLVVVLLAVPIGTMAASQDAKHSEGQIEDQALKVITRYTNFLTNLKQLHVSTEFGFDVLQENGQMIEFGSHQEITVQRPDQFRVDFTRRDGDSGSIVYDSKEITIFSPEESVYAKTPFEGEVDDAFKFLVEKLNLSIPMRDFFANDLNVTLLAKIESGQYVEESTVGGVLCDHLALRNSYVDFQLWIAQGDEPLPRRLVITYKNDEGRPQFWAQFQRWESSPKITAGHFSYSPPAGTERIPFASLDADADADAPKDGGKP